MLDLYVCLRPVRWFKGVPSPVKRPDKVDMVIFRENTEDIYAGIEFEAGTAENRKFLELFKQAFPKEYGKIRFPETSGIGIKPVSQEGTERLVRAAIEYAIDNKRKSVTIVHKGNIMKFTEGAFRNWGYALAEREFGAQVYTWEQWERTKADKGEKAANAEQDAAKKAGKVIVKDAIADITLQQVLTRPDEFDVIATMNLNGDYLSDALAAQVGGIGIAPGGNINYVTGHAVFEATHGTAPKYANLDKVNPGSVILSGEMMLRYMGWTEAADAIINGDGRHDRAEERHLRLRAPDGGRDRGQVQRVRRRADPQPLIAAAAPGRSAARVNLVAAPVATARRARARLRADARRRVRGLQRRVPRRHAARAAALRRARLARQPEGRGRAHRPLQPLRRRHRRADARTGWATRSASARSGRRSSGASPRSSTRCPTTSSRRPSSAR